MGFAAPKDSLSFGAAQSLGEVMSKHTAIAMGLFWTLATAVSAAESPSDRATVEVVGHGEASAPAEVAKLSYTITGEGKSSQEALQAFVAAKMKVEDALKALAGASSIDIQSDNLSVAEVRADACRSSDSRSAYFLATEPCQVIGYLAGLHTTVTLSPAKFAGNALSLASEMGARSPKLDEVDLKDSTAVRVKAVQAALADAHGQAAAIAAASGSQLGPLIKVTDNDARDGTEVGPVIVTAERRNSPISPAVAIDYAPPPIKRNATFTVVYELLH